MPRATIRTDHDDPETVAAAVRPDNTAEMTTAVRDDAVVTTIERETTAGLQSTVDDYVVNLGVADRAASAGGEQPPAAAGEERPDAEHRAADGSDLGEQNDDRPNEPNHE